MTTPDIDAWPAIARGDDGGPVFRAPWEAQAFAIVVLLHKRGHVTWPEWTDRLSEEITAATARGEDNDGSRYYRHWLAALERLVADKGLVLEDELRVRHREWAEAARSTPHGKPIVLPGR